MRNMSIDTEKWPLHKPFIISRLVQLNGEVIVVTVEQDGCTGRGECERMDVFEPDYPDILKMIESVKPLIEAGLSREELPLHLPAGAARNAVDCALFELEANMLGCSTWELAGLKNSPSPVTTVFTLSLDTPENMASAAALENHRPILKLKLGRDGDLERVRAIRAAAPNTRLVIDANTGWSFAQLEEYLPHLVNLGVEMIEQPLPPLEEHLLSGLNPAIPIVADESCLDRSSLPMLMGRYQAINIKLDKTGGITEGLALLEEGQKLGFDIMVGCMIGTSLAMAPALLLAQQARWVDIDGPLLLSRDRDPALHYEGSTVNFVKGVWG
ncbi:dipeptide epimerase [Marinomonas sp. A79]|uniref:Dipeptide epimerase n=2 Tax=Marinomonas vulgaris TaxID=2823372 RepID=A0ABS5HFA8_9GAMM|nr:dipeptide epimerase [Marinomonas vulgaris]